MLPRILIATALVLAAVPALAQSDRASTNGHAGLQIRMGRPGIRVHEAATPPADVVRVHSAAGEPTGTDIPIHGVTNAFAPSRVLVQQIAPGQTRIRVHGLADAARPSRIRVHGVANP